MVDGSFSRAQSNPVLRKAGIVAILALAFFLSLKLLPEAEYLPSGNQNFVLIFAKALVGTNLDKQLESLQLSKPSSSK